MIPRQLRTYLNSLRAPVAAMAGLSVESVIIYAQQDLASHIAKAISCGKCAVLLGVKAFSSKVDARVPGPPMDCSLEVSIWTPEVTDEGSPITLDVAEAIVRGLHGRKPAEGAPGLALIPKFQHAGISSQTGPNGQGKFMVATLDFEFPIALRDVSAPAGVI